MKLLLDTNIVLYFLAGKLKEPLDDNQYCVSVITQLELLSYPGMDEAAESTTEDFLNQIEIVELNPGIVKQAIEVRKKYRMKLPDSIIIATAKFLEVEILSNDLQFAKIPEIKCRSLALATT